MDKMESAPLSAPAGGALALSPAAVGGRRHPLKKVSAKTIKRTLRKLGMKPKGRVVIKGGEMEAMEKTEMPPPPMAGKRKTKKAKRSASRRKSIFGL
jgi:hypothetical protein